MTDPTFQHAALASGRWETLSLPDQLGQIGSEVGRAARWRGRNERRFEGAAIRALELMDLTLRDPRWRTRLKEIARVRELFCHAVWGEAVFGTTLEDLDRYFYFFARASRRPSSSADPNLEAPPARG